MANNSIALFQKYVPYLDEVYKLESRTSILDSPPELARAGANANEIIIPKLSMDGLGDYSRNGGYVDGAVTMTNETVKFNYERGRKFSVDVMDDEETSGLAFGRLAAEFERLKVAPELDAFRFAMYAGIPGISSATPADLTSGQDVLDAIVAAKTALDEAEVPSTERYCFITPTLRNLAKAVDSYKSKEALDSFTAVIEVPQTRFYTAIDLKDGVTAGEEAGGYEKNAAGKDINFIIIHRPAVMQYNKRVVNSVIRPENNPDADGYIIKFRRYGLADAYENKVAGIYLHNKA